MTEFEKLTKMTYDEIEALSETDSTYRTIVILEQCQKDHMLLDTNKVFEKYPDQMVVAYNGEILGSCPSERWGDFLDELRAKGIPVNYAAHVWTGEVADSWTYRPW